MDQFQQHYRLLGDAILTGNSPEAARLAVEAADFFAAFPRHQQWLAAEPLSNVRAAHRGLQARIISTTHSQFAPLLRGSPLARLRKYQHVSPRYRCPMTISDLLNPELRDESPNHLPQKGKILQKICSARKFSGTQRLHPNAELEGSSLLRRRHRGRTSTLQPTAQKAEETMTYQHLHALGGNPSLGLNIDAGTADRTAIDLGQRALSFACWLMIAASGLGLIAVTEKAIRNVLHTLHSCGAC